MMAATLALPLDLAPAGREDAPPPGPEAWDALSMTCW